MEQQTPARSLKNILLSKWYFPNTERAIVSNPEEKDLPVVMEHFFTLRTP
jgi:hypothetical protein